MTREGPGTHRLLSENFEVKREVFRAFLDKKKLGPSVHPKFSIPLLINNTVTFKGAKRTKRPRSLEGDGGGRPRYLKSSVRGC